MAKKKKNLLNNFERDILRLLGRNPHSLSVNAIAEKLGISYNTVRKYLDTLLKKKLIMKDEDGKR